MYACYLPAMSSERFLAVVMGLSRRRSSGLLLRSLTFCFRRERSFRLGSEAETQRGSKLMMDRNMKRAHRLFAGSTKKCLCHFLHLLCMISGRGNKKQILKRNVLQTIRLFFVCLFVLLVRSWLKASNWPLTVKHLQTFILCFYCVIWFPCDVIWHSKVMLSGGKVCL